MNAVFTGGITQRRSALKVPADSKPSPWGEMMGVLEARLQAPKGTRIWVVVAAAITATSTKPSIRPRAPVKIFGMRFVPSFRARFFRISIPGSHHWFWNINACQKSATIRTMACPGTFNVSAIGLPFSLHRTFALCADGTVRVAERLCKVGL
jgi:hypothetical protein